MQQTTPTPQPHDEDRRRQRTDEVFEALPHLGPAERATALDEVITLNMPVAARLARRFTRRGIPDDDLRQVAYLALTKAAQRYDLARAGTSFLSYAVPTVRGELRKHFRDRGWMVRPTRRVQELQQKVNRARELLTARLARDPSAEEIGAQVDEPVEDVLEAMAADGCFTPTSLDAPAGGDADGAPSPLADTLGADDAGMLAAEARAEVEPLLRELPERDRRIIGLRFYEGLTQREIADDIGVTQMQVSRLLSRILTQMRHTLERPAA